ncbi:MAG: ribosome-associated translation inhibitor RaiA [Firmicutes bacterium]|nr:ribosome-associated translation inhibitor RaiA [Bacillota bacterium]
MQVTYKARNMEITDALKEYAEKRLAKFDKLIGAKEATVTMHNVKDRCRLEITLPYNGVLIRGEEEGYDMFTCIDNVTDKVESQIHKYRSRLIKRGRGVSAKVEAPAAPEWQEDDMPVKLKTFTTKPMSVEEAIMQMNLLSHNFFVFVNTEGNMVNVLYKRHDGDYGLLAPEE